MSLRKIPDQIDLNWVSKNLLVDLPKITDSRGNLSFIESSRHLPFEIKRVFYLYDVPSGESRGAHAHRELTQFLIPLSGAFSVTLDTGTSKVTVPLQKPWQGLIIPPMCWAYEHDFTTGGTCLVLVDDFYKAEDYVRDYEEFLRLRK